VRIFTSLNRSTRMVSGPLQPRGHGGHGRTSAALAWHGVAFRSFTEEHLSTENELARNFLLATLASLPKLQREKISQRTKAGLERARAKSKAPGPAEICRR